MSESKILVVTGGSRGIGAATARLASANGWRVCIAYLSRRDAAEGVVRDILRREGACDRGAGRHRAPRPAWFSCFAKWIGNSGTVTALVNNGRNLGNANAARLNGRVPDLGGFYRRTCSVRCSAPAEAVRRMSTKARGKRRGDRQCLLRRGQVRFSLAKMWTDAASKGAIDTFTVGFGEGGCRGRDPRQRRSPRAHLYLSRMPKEGEPQRVDRVKASVPMQRGGAARRDRVCDLVAVISRSILHHWHDCRCVRGPLGSAQ